MIEINLLPHREAKRAADLRETFALLVLGMVAVCAGIAFVHSGVHDDMVSAQANVRQLEADIEQYKPQEAQVGIFKAKKAELQEKLDVIKGLDRARSGPVKILDALSSHTPERLWVTRLETRGRQITVEGESLDTGVVADFLRSLNGSSQFINVDLDQTARGKEVDGVRLVNFTVTAELAGPSADAENEEEGV